MGWPSSPRPGWLHRLSRSLRREAFGIPRHGPGSGGEAAASVEELGRAAAAAAALGPELGAARRPKEAGGWRCHSCQGTHGCPLGGPGSGKGSQCKQLAKKYGFAHLSTSDLLQNELSSLSERSKLIKDIVECGEAVPGGIVLELLREAMVSKLGDTKGFLIDGYPQELKDAEEFESKIGEPKLVLCLDCSAETMSSRLLMRNQSSHNSENSETIVERIESYYQASNPLIAYYESKTQLCKVDAEGTQEDVFLEVCKTIDSFLKKEEAAFSFSPEMQ